MSQHEDEDQEDHNNHEQENNSTFTLKPAIQFIMTSKNPTLQELLHSVISLFFHIEMA